jgi:peptidoglycan hydrolase-like protein with peptidoglycan-binding domain
MTADWYDTMHAAERVRFVQRVLARHGYYRGAVTGTLDSATQDAIARYQAATDLILSGRIDLALYRQLISRDLPERLRQAQDGMRSATAPAVELPAVFSPMHYQTQRVQTGRGHPRP